MPTRFRWSDFVLDLDSYRLERAGAPLSLEPKAFNLLALMIRRPGHVFSKQEIFEAVWPGTAVTDHALTRVVAQLRRVLGDEAREARYLETVPTRGYRWIHPVEEVDVAAGGSKDPPLLSNAPAATTPTPAGTTSRRAIGILPGLAASLVLAVVALLFLLWAQRGAPTSATGLADSARVNATSGETERVKWPVQVTTHAGLDLQPAISPQGDALAFASDRSGSFEIYIRGIGGTAVDTPLTRDGGFNLQPAWSPDGRLIAFHSSRRGGVWVIPARGGVARQIVPIGSKPAWSPDGKRIAFQSDEHTDLVPTGFGAEIGSTIWIADADGANAHAVTRGDRPIGGHAAPSWSGDGRFIAFSLFEAGPKNGLWLLDIASGTTSQLHGGNDYESVFAPDGSNIYVAGGDALIFRVPFDAAAGGGRGAVDVIPVAGVAGVRGLTISGDGRRLGFAAISVDSHIWLQQLRGDGVPAAPARPLTNDTSRRNSVPVISPDGSKVAYVSTRQGEEPNVWVMAIDGRDSLQITSDETADRKPIWFPDGRRLAYLSRKGSTAGLWSVDITTRREELLLDFTKTALAPGPGGRFGEFELSPSITALAFSVIEPPSGRRAMFVTPIDRYTPRAVGGGEASVGYPAWSRDEKQLAVEIKGDSTHVGVIDLETGSFRQLTRDRGQTWVRSWSPDGRRVAVAALRDGLWSLQSIDASSGRPATILPASPPRIYVRYPEWSPLGNAIVFERGEMRGNIWTLRIP